MTAAERFAKFMEDPANVEQRKKDEQVRVRPHRDRTEEKRFYDAKRYQRKKQEKQDG